MAICRQIQKVYLRRRSKNPEAAPALVVPKTHSNQQFLDQVLHEHLEDLPEHRQDYLEPHRISLRVVGKVWEVQKTSGARNL